MKRISFHPRSSPLDPPPDSCAQASRLPWRFSARKRGSMYASRLLLLDCVLWDKKFQSPTKSFPIMRKRKRSLSVGTQTNVSQKKILPIVPNLESSMEYFRPRYCSPNESQFYHLRKDIFSPNCLLREALLLFRLILPRLSHRLFQTKRGRKCTNFPSDGRKRSESLIERTQWSRRGCRAGEGSRRW